MDEGAAFDMKGLRSIFSPLLPLLMLISSARAVGVADARQKRFYSNVQQQHRAVLIASIMEDLELLEMSSRFFVLFSCIVLMRASSLLSYKQKRSN